MGAGSTHLLLLRKRRKPRPPAPTLSYASPQSWTYGVAISTLSPTTTGATSFAVTTGALPTGVSLNPSTGAITGTPTAWEPSGSFKVTATGAGGSTESGLVSWTMAFASNSVAGLDGWWDFSDAASLFQASDGTTAVAADADPIGYATDKSGAGNHVIQATAGFRPTYRAGIQNGLSVGRFDGVEDFLNRTGISYAQPNHVFIVGRYISASDNTMFDGFFNQMRLYRSSGNIRIFGGANLTVATTPEAWHAYALKFDGASSDLNIDGSSNTGDAGTATATEITLGAAQPLGVYGNVEIGEALFFGTASLTAEQIAGVLAYLKSKWATP